MSDNLDKIKIRIQALSAKTVDNGCTEAEALSAMEKVGQLLREYNLSMSEIDMKKENCIQDYFKINGKSRNNNIGALCGSIGLFTDTKCWVDKNSERHSSNARGEPTSYVKYVFFGLESDVKLASYLLYVCTRAMLNDTRDYIKSLNLIGAGNHRIPQNNFQMGFASRVSARLREIKAANNAAMARAQGTGTNLIVLKNQLVTEEFDNIGMKLTSHAAPKPQFDRDHFKAGQEAGNKINLSNPISDRSNGLKIA